MRLEQLGHMHMASTAARLLVRTWTPLINITVISMTDTWNILDAPGATLTEAYDIDGSKIVVGTRTTEVITSVSLYGTTWNTLNSPGAWASALASTAARLLVLMVMALMSRFSMTGQPGTPSMRLEQLIQMHMASTAARLLVRTWTL